MELYKDLDIFDGLDLWIFIIGVAILAASILPRILSRYPFSLPIVLLCVGFIVVALPIGMEPPDPFEHNLVTERLTELGVIVALMGAGLKIDRKPGLKTWCTTWRLLAITMPLSIALTVVAGWWIAAFVPATAMLLGAVIAPTDPVLAAEVQIASPGRKEDFGDPDNDKIKLEKEDEVRFALTSEAGLNDGLAFPFTYMAVAMMMAGTHPENWIVDWFLVDVLFKLGMGILMGVVLGYLLARILMSVSAENPIAKALLGLGALAATLILYGATEYVGGYGFIATFIGAVTIRNYEKEHHYHESLYLFAEKSEHILIAIIVLALGGAIAGGLLVPLTWQHVLAAVVIIFVIRPVAGIVGLTGLNKVSWPERMVISFFGIRGVGSLYYLSYALNQHEFPDSEEIWALVALVVVISIFVHGVTATPVTEKLDKLRNGK